MLATSAAATAQRSIHPTTPPVAEAVRRTGNIVIDGRLDEPDWAAATPITAFRQTQPTEGAPATQRTEVRILYDADAIYIGARMYDSLGARGVHGIMVRRDQTLDLYNLSGGSSQFTSDKLTVILDPYHDHLTMTMFEINPNGVIGDALGAGGSNLDPSWDPVWSGAARVDSLGWTAEFRIPLSQLRFAYHEDAQTWGMQILRVIDRLNERDEWAFARRNADNSPATYGHLTGLVFGHPPTQFEILPYVSAQTEGYAGYDGDPLNPVHQNQLRVGGDLKYLVTSNMTLDATINPDFGEVDVDPAVVNLSAFETFYPEKRPFFVSGSGAFDFGGFNCMFCSNVSSLSLFYSRRIGRYPQLGNYYGNLAAYSNIPANTSIIGAAKITGRTESGFTVGFLDAVTNQENGVYTMGLDSAHHVVPMEPLSNYLVARVKRDLGDGATTVGGMLTSTIRRLDSPILADSLHEHAEALGGDFRTTWQAKNYSLMASFAISNVSGTPASILLTQQSSAHYFQRPDRQNVGGGFFADRYDSSATSLRGYGAYLRLGKDNGNWLWEVATNIRSPGFEVNDLAYMQRADYLWYSANVARNWTVPGSWYRNLFAIVGGQTQFNYDGDQISPQVQAFWGGQLLNYWGFRSYVLHRATSLDDQLTRGGPVVMRNGINDAFIGFNSDARKALVISLGVEASRGLSEPGQEVTPQFSALFKPMSNMSITFSPTFDFVRSDQQYDTVVAAVNLPEFYNQRYIFASINQTTISLDTRVDVAFTPTLTLDVYVQPFLANGHYYAFSQFDQPRQLHKSVFGREVGSIASLGSDMGYCIDPTGTPGTIPSCGGPGTGSDAFIIANPDFTTRSLRGNAVLRWEYLPGSTLFLVWQQTRSDDTLFGDAANVQFNRDQAALLRAPADNIFVIKVAYWLGR
jgi:hypothetical protein